MKVQQKSVLIAGIAYLAMSIFHIPDSIFRHGFDKNAPAQLVALLVVGAVFSIAIALKSHRFNFPKYLRYGTLALVASQLISLLLSKSLIGSFFGDSGRFVGMASMLALLAVSIFHAQFNFKDFIYLIRFYVVAVEIVVLLGIAQHFNLIQFPGDQGVTSTLGNTDFFAAYVGTGLPLLILLGLQSSQRMRITLAVAAGVNCFALWLAGPLQGYLDIAFTVSGATIIILRKKFPRRNLSLNARTYLGTFAVVIWAEFIFLMPFLGSFIPVLGNDVQVKIRSNFWLAGLREFFAHPILGVGPDQYGNYYEQYRTLDDISKFTNILSNDAHSASVQTLATTGIIGTLAFLFLLGLVIRGLLILWDSTKFDRTFIFVLGLYIFVYLTNSFVSPITLTHKYIFWAVCGFIVGQAYRKPPRKTVKVFSNKVSGALVGAALISAAVVFAQAQLSYLVSIEKYAKDNTAVVEYRASPAIPCMMYFDAQLLMAVNHGNDFAIEFIKKELRDNSRCVPAQIAITRAAVNSGNMENLKPYIYHLLEIAPARQDAISFGMYYANRAGDGDLRAHLERIMKRLGLVYIPGKLG